MQLVAFPYRRMSTEVQHHWPLRLRLRAATKFQLKNYCGRLVSFTTVEACDVESAIAYMLPTEIANGANKHKIYSLVVVGDTVVVMVGDVSIVE